jgi:hypothetical protein
MKTILAIQPATLHVGYAVFEDTMLVDFGSKSLRSGPRRVRDPSRARLIFRRLVDQCEPDVIILPKPNKCTAARRRFLREIQSDLTVYPHHVVTFGWREIQQTFKSVLSRKYPNKYSIMQVLAKSFPELHLRLPKPRRMWDAEDHQTPMFDAVALVITHLHHHE